MINLNGKNALVTGGANGIGKGIAIVLAAQGANVVVSDVDLESAQLVASEIRKSGNRSNSIFLDVTSKDSAQSVASDLIDRLGTIDILVNNAGVVGADGWWTRRIPSDDDWKTVIEINLMGVVNVSQAVETDMKNRKKGKIINIASIAARQGNTGIPHYNASKAAVVSWTQSHALQLAPYQVNVNAICPGLLWTPIWEAIAENRTNYGYDSSLKGFSGRELFDKTVESWIPMGREQTPEDVGKLAAFLVSEDSMNITGQAINLDGGRYMN